MRFVMLNRAAISISLVYTGLGHLSCGLRRLSQGRVADVITRPHFSTPSSKTSMIAIEHFSLSHHLYSSVCQLQP